LRKLTEIKSSLKIKQQKQIKDSLKIENKKLVNN